MPEYKCLKPREAFEEIASFNVMLYQNIHIHFVVKNLRARGRCVNVAAKEHESK